MRTALQEERYGALKREIRHLQGRLDWDNFYVNAHMRDIRAYIKKQQFASMQVSQQHLSDIKAQRLRTLEELNGAHKELLSLETPLRVSTSYYFRLHTRFYIHRREEWGEEKEWEMRKYRAIASLENAVKGMRLNVNTPVVKVY